MIRLEPIKIWKQKNHQNSPTLNSNISKIDLYKANHTFFDRFVFFLRLPPNQENTIIKII